MWWIAVFAMTFIDGDMTLSIFFLMGRFMAYKVLLKEVSNKALRGGFRLVAPTISDSNGSPTDRPAVGVREGWTLQMWHRRSEDSVPAGHFWWEGGRKEFVMNCRPVIFGRFQSRGASEQCNCSLVVHYLFIILPFHSVLGTKTFHFTTFYSLA